MSGARTKSPARLPRPGPAPVRAEVEALMAQAIAEARLGLGQASPNPTVGALVVRDGQVLARGHTAPVGGPHAEVEALRVLGGRAPGADLYTTLEPCNHQGRTPPCTEAIVRAGIARVFVGSPDPNPRVRGGGSARLLAEGVQVVEGVLRPQCDELHAAFFKHVTTGLPLVTLKIASTLDGRLAASSGDSRWVTGEAARAQVHRLRSEVDAVLVGAGTARADNPLLTARGIPGARQPLRVVLDGREPLPLKLKLFRDRSATTLLATSSRDPRRLRALARAGVEVVHCPRRRVRELDLEVLLRALGERGVTHLLCEGGAALGSALVRQRLADRLMLFLAPRLLGSGTPWLSLPPTQAMAEALQLTQLKVELVGPDLLLTGSLPVRAGLRRASAL